jgi:radical SAM superfamily enzyme YgiQ (UPF0313 family)
MKEAGCNFIGCGLESGSPAVLKSMKKETSTEQIAHAVEVICEAGLGVQGNFILGDPAESLDTIEETRQFFLTRCKDLMVYFDYVRPYPGSELFQHCLDRGIIKDRQGYYEGIGSGGYQFNMTGMAEELFLESVRPLMLMVGDPANFKSTTALSWKRYANEIHRKNAKFAYGKILYRIVAVCPHCSEKSEYIYPISAKLARFQRHLIAFCTKCHRRFSVESAGRRRQVRPALQ